MTKQPGTILPNCTVKIIDDSIPFKPMWKTIARCVYDPAEMRKALSIVNLRGAWFFFDNEKRYITVNDLNKGTY